MYFIEVHRIKNVATITSGKSQLKYVGKVLINVSAISYIEEAPSWNINDMEPKTSFSNSEEYEKIKEINPSDKFSFIYVVVGKEKKQFIVAESYTKVCEEIKYATPNSN